MAGLGVLELGLTANTVKFDANVNRSRDALGRFVATSKQAPGVLSSTGSAASSLTRGIAGLATSLAIFGTGAAVAGVVNFGRKSAAAMETTRAQFETMLGSAQAADEIVGELFDFSKATPFDPSDVFGSGRQLLAAGFDVRDIKGQLEDIGDVAAGSGSDLQGLAAIFAEVRSKGKADLQDLKQFAVRGIPIFQALGASMGVGEDEIRKMVSSGKIGLAEIQGAFQSLTAEGGLFNGAMERISKTQDGLFSTLQGNLSAAAGEFTQVILKWAGFKEGLSSLNQLIEETDFSEWAASTISAFDEVDKVITDLQLGILGTQDLLAQLVATKAEKTEGGNVLYDTFRTFAEGKNESYMTPEIRAKAEELATRRTERRNATERLLRDMRSDQAKSQDVQGTTDAVNTQTNILSQEIRQLKFLEPFGPL